VIHQEYFAQLSQIIPLLLVAIGLEAHFFERLLTEPVQRAMTIVSIVILCIGEALAISALPTDNEGPGDVLYGWHEYSAFVLTVQGVAIVLAILVWALVDEPPRDHHETKGDPGPQEDSPDHQGARGFEPSG
jgi:hypothetical protein